MSQLAVALVDSLGCFLLALLASVRHGVDIIGAPYIAYAATVTQRLAVCTARPPRINGVYRAAF